MRTIAVSVTATVEEQKELERWVRAQGTPQGVVRRARIVLATLAGMSSKEIGRKLRVSHPYGERNALIGVNRSVSHRCARVCVADTRMLR